MFLNIHINQAIHVVKKTFVNMYNVVHVVIIKKAFGLFLFVYNYENKIYEHLSTISDIMFIVDNNKDIDDAIETISNIVEQKTDIRKKVSYERKI